MQRACHHWSWADVTFCADLYGERWCIKKKYPGRPYSAKRECDNYEVCTVCRAIHCHKSCSDIAIDLFLAIPFECIFWVILMIEALLLQNHFIRIFALFCNFFRLEIRLCKLFAFLNVRWRCLFYHSVWLKTMVIFFTECSMNEHCSIMSKIILQWFALPERSLMFW